MGLYSGHGLIIGSFTRIEAQLNSDISVDELTADAALHAPFCHHFAIISPKNH